jgi:hypothetical protein
VKKRTPIVTAESSEQRASTGSADELFGIQVPLPRFAPHKVQKDGRVMACIGVSEMPSQCWREK